MLISPVSQQGHSSSFIEGGVCLRPNSQPLSVDIPASRWQRPLVRRESPSLLTTDTPHLLAWHLLPHLKGPSQCVLLGRERVDMSQTWACPWETSNETDYQAINPNKMTFLRCGRPCGVGKEGGQQNPHRPGSDPDTAPYQLSNLGLLHIVT